MVPPWWFGLCFGSRLSIGIDGCPPLVIGRSFYNRAGTPNVGAVRQKNQFSHERGCSCPDTARNAKRKPIALFDAILLHISSASQPAALKPPRNCGCRRL